ncbi:hypothetical protein ACFXPT_24830 [Streptomyces goshikiensis]|uniref:hypothetical protein n=1 Tax=Streptomyces goshikiensis TaxID=1942 RepID=UPI0036851761
MSTASPKDRALRRYLAEQWSDAPDQVTTELPHLEPHQLRKLLSSLVGAGITVRVIADRSPTEHVVAFSRLDDQALPLIGRPV